MRTTVYENYKFRSIPAENADFCGYYVTSERFYHLPSVRQYGHDRKPEFSSAIQNVHTHYRKAFRISADVKCATLLMSGDDVYKAYIKLSFIIFAQFYCYVFAKGG